MDLKKIRISGSLLSLWLVLAALIGTGPVHAADETPPPPPPGANVFQEDEGELSPFGEKRPRLIQDAPALPAAPTGGPDHYGYTWEEPASLNWIEASGGTQAVFPSPDNATTNAVNIGFDFKFYNNTYSQLYISTNGILTFGEANASPYGTALPQDTEPNNMVAVFWDNLVVGGTYNTGKVTYLNGGTGDGQYFVVEWQSVSRRGSPDLLTFQAVLYKSGDILFQYKVLNGALDQCSIGIEDETGLDGLNYLYKASGLASGSAVRFKRPAPQARVSFLSKYQSAFAVGGQSIFSINLVNTGELGTDTYQLTNDLASQPGGKDWSVSLFKSDGITPLKDTNGDHILDTGPVAQGDQVKIVAVLGSPSKDTVGASTQFHLSASSSKLPLNFASRDQITLQSSVPASFAQAYVDTRFGIGLDLTWAKNHTHTIVDTGFTGSSLAMGYVTGGRYFYLWEKNGVKTSGVPFTDVEYALVDRFGTVIRSRVKLTNNKEVGDALWQVRDNLPNLASTQNQRTAIVWARDLIDFNTNKIQSNVFLAILDFNGEILKKETNLTHQDWYLKDALDKPDYGALSVAATADNHFVVLWMDERKESGGDVSDIYYSVYDQNGNQTKQPVKLTASLPDKLSFGDPVLTTLSGNRVLASYSSYDAVADAYSLWYAVLDSSGNLVKAHQSLPGVSGWRPDAIQLSTGPILLAWTNSTNADIGYGILNGTTYTLEKGPFNLSNPQGRLADDASVTSDDQGNGIITWMDARWNNYLFYALVGDQGSLKAPSMVFYPGDNAAVLVTTSDAGMGNAFYDGKVYAFLPAVSR
jgi:hypothetical protein